MSFVDLRTGEVVGGEIVSGVPPFVFPGAHSSRIGRVMRLADDIADWLGSNSRVIHNDAGDRIFLSQDGTRKIRFDFHNTGGDRPHMHFEILRNGRWRDFFDGVHRIYPGP